VSLLLVATAVRADCAISTIRFGAIDPAGAVTKVAATCDATSAIKP
jgi:hypothetical protein